jgi:hypothetical protein
MTGDVVVGKVYAYTALGRVMFRSVLLAALLPSKFTTAMFDCAANSPGVVTDVRTSRKPLPAAARSVSRHVNWNSACAKGLVGAYVTVSGEPGVTDISDKPLPSAHS